MTGYILGEGGGGIWVRYLGLFVDVPGEGDCIVGDFLNVADCVEALLVIRCEVENTRILNQLLHEQEKL